MLIDQTHKKWMGATVMALVVASTAFFSYALRRAIGPMGGSALGLAYGVAGFALMLLAGLLGVRKKVSTWRIGRAQDWMRGHLWLGVLSLPLILFHSGFEFGGVLTTILMTLLIVVVTSGVVGAALQHFLPRVMMARVTKETIYNEIPNVRLQLRTKAQRLVTDVCGPLPGGPRAAEIGLNRSTVPHATGSEVKEEDRARLREFYLRKVGPFLETPEARGHSLATASKAKDTFQQFRIRVSPALREIGDELEDICEEARQLNQQVRLHRWLHGWLLVHVPLSLALLVLGAVHAIVALRY
jgi:hypothetical protein